MLKDMFSRLLGSSRPCESAPRAATAWEMSLLEQVKRMAPTDPLIGAKVADGTRLFFGDSLNRYLAEDAFCRSNSARFSLTAAGQRPLLFGFAIQDLMTQTKNALNPCISLQIVMESAVPMSKLDLASTFGVPDGA